MDDRLDFIQKLVQNREDFNQEGANSTSMFAKYLMMISIAFIESASKHKHL